MKKIFLFTLVFFVASFSQQQKKNIDFYGCPSDELKLKTLSKCRLNWAKLNKCRVFKDDNNVSLLFRCLDELEEKNIKVKNYKKQ